LTNKHFLGLDGLRGVAAISVLIMHLSLWFSTDKLLSGANLAVDFFFCLSGFVIAHAYAHKIDSGMGFARFLWVRVKRLHPLLILGFTLGAAYYILNMKAANSPAHTANIYAVLESYVLSIFMIPHENSAIDVGIFPINGVSWSIFFEFCANIIYYFIVRYTSKRVSRWAFVLIIIPIPYFALQYQTFMQGFLLSGLTAGLQRVSISFFIGVLLHDYCKARPASLQLPSPMFFLLVVALVGAMAAKTAFPGVGYELFVIILAFPLIIFFAANLAPGKLDGMMKVLGDISYPLYILHKPLTYLTVGLLKRLPFFHGTADPNLLICAGLILIGAAWVALKVYDEPLRASFRRS